MRFLPANPTRQVAAAAALCLLLATGCSSHRNTWRSPAVVAPLDLQSPQALAGGLSPAEWNYAQAFALEQSGQAECVDFYYQAAVAAWPTIAASHGGGASREQDLYHSAVTRMLVAAQHHGRWRPGQGLLVAGRGGLVPVPTAYDGFAWQPAEFSELAPVGKYELAHLKRRYNAPGLGVPLVVVRRGPCIEPFMQVEESFAATAVLRPCSASADGSAGEVFTLELINPLASDTISTSGRSTPLARDISAPFAYPPPENNDLWLQDFLLPGSSTEDGGLYMLEPYQPNKIPVVLIHGLLSDPATWLNMVNDLRADRDIADKYQFWAFRYSTGTQFFRSAATLRKELHQLRATYDPQRDHPAHAQMVLVGHSMGGLVAKLQVTFAGDALWSTLANRPPSQIVTTPATRDGLVSQMFFDPNPDVSRVVFIGTPHQGSSDASRCIGRLGSLLAEQSPETKQEHDQLLRDNPGVFTAEIERRIPSSIDLLKPDNPFLLTMLGMPFSQRVRVHSICGVVNRPLRPEPTDGVVPLWSAQLAGVCSEAIVDSKHTELTHDNATIREVARILRLHTQCR